MIQRLRAWLAGLFRRAPWRAQFVEDVPEKLRRRTVYLLGEDASSAWAAAMACPCGCGQSIQLSLVENDHPSWRVRVDDDGQVSLEPSVWRLRGCHAHFFVRDGQIAWAKRGRPRYGRPAPGRAPRSHPGR